MAESKAKDPGLEMVTIRLFKDGGEYKDDVFVSVNDMRYRIKRGVDVQVPKCIAEVIRQSEEQAANTAMMISGLEEEYKNKSRKYE